MVIHAHDEDEVRPKGKDLLPQEVTQHGGVGAGKAGVDDLKAARPGASIQKVLEDSREGLLVAIESAEGG